jgi:hypothetical protein
MVATEQNFVVFYRDQTSETWLWCWRCRKGTGKLRSKTVLTKMFKFFLQVYAPLLHSKSPTFEPDSIFPTSKFTLRDGRFASNCWQMQELLIQLQALRIRHSTADRCLPPTYYLLNVNLAFFPVYSVRDVCDFEDVARDMAG